MNKKDSSPKKILENYKKTELNRKEFSAKKIKEKELREYIL